MKKKKTHVHVSEIGTWPDEQAMKNIVLKGRQTGIPTVVGAFFEPSPLWERLMGGKAVRTWAEQNDGDDEAEEMIDAVRALRR